MAALKGSFGKFLQHQARTAPGMTKRATDASLKEMKGFIETVTPVRTGKFKRSMKKSKVTRRVDGRLGWEGEVYSKLSYAWVVNQGRKAGMVEAGPGKWFVVGGKRVKRIHQEAFTGRRYFNKGAFDFSAKRGTSVLVEIGDEWIAASMIKTGQHP